MPAKAGIHVFSGNRTKGGWVYVMTNRPDGALYVGVTSNLARRVGEHKSAPIDSFTKTYGLTLLVYAERYEDIRDAIQRERRIKKWRRAWKVQLIHAINRNWDDLSSSLI